MFSPKVATRPATKVAQRRRGAQPARSALLIAGHPPGRGSGSSMRGAATLAALRSCCDTVDAVAFANREEASLADPDVVLIDRPPKASPVERLASLPRGGPFYAPERRVGLGKRLRDLVASGRLRSSYGVVWAHSSLVARAPVEALAVGAEVLDIDNVAGAEMRRDAERLPATSPRGAFRRLNAWATSREERRRCAEADVVVVTSDVERERLGDVGVPVHVVPASVPDPGPPTHPAAAPQRMLFLGSLDYGPNLDALRYLLADILPRVRATVPEAELVVAGRSPGPDVEALCRKTGAELVANAPSIEPLYGSARVVLAPMRRGGGVSIKVLEAMAHGSAIVATPLVAGPIGLEDRRDAYLAPDSDVFAARCVELLEDPSAAERLGAGARTAWHDHHGPAVAHESIVGLVEPLLPERGSRRFA